MSFLERWKEQGLPAPQHLSSKTILSNRYDDQRYQALLKEMKAFADERGILCEVVQETGGGLWGDAFNAFNKVQPEILSEGQIKPLYLINKAIMEQATRLTEYQRLREFTAGDGVAAAGACMILRPELEKIYDRTKAAQEHAKSMQEKLEELLSKMQDQRDLDQLEEDWSDKNDELQEQIDQLEQEIQDAEDDLNSELDNQAVEMRIGLRQAMAAAADEAASTASTSHMWGLDPGSLKRMPAEKRLALAKRLNNPRFKRMADLFGPLEREMAAEKQRRVNYLPQEVFDITVGKDLEHVLPSEFSKLIHPQRKLEFYKAFVEGNLLSYRLRGTEKVARGGIICCIDSSGSMGGDPDLWAKAVGLTLLHLAMSQKRSFRGIIFGSASEVKEFNFDKSYELDKVIDFAEFFYGGGTNFQSPLSVALQHLIDDYEKTGDQNADIVFITDGYCGVPEAWKKNFLSEMERVGANAWGIAIGVDRTTQPLYDLCGGKVVTIGDILNASKDLQKVFAGVI